MFIKIFKSN